MKSAHCLVAALLSCLVLTPGVANGEQNRATKNNQNAQQTERRQARFRAMDTNRDGVITRQEWRGNTRSFERHDTNRDGVLSGNEIWTTDDADWQERGGRDNALVQTFRRADTNRDGILSRNEWASGSDSFNRVDVNDDGVITEPEFLGEGWERDDAWEAEPGDATAAGRFRDADTNRDGVVARAEWRGSEASFNRMDANDDGVLTRREFLAGTSGDESGTTGARRDSPAFQSGYDRGLADGRQAGREDRQLRNQWDLEGQRELEQADAGYSPNVGSRGDYQAGYRAGFRAGYRQGFGPR